MNFKNVPEDSELDNEIQKVFDALSVLCRFIEEKHPERSHAVMLFKDGEKLIMYSPRHRYTRQLCQLTWTPDGDKWPLPEIEGEK